MPIVERIKNALTERVVDLNKNKEFTKLRDFHEEMRREGIMQKQPYSLPPLDTVGRRLRQRTSNKTSR